MEPTIGRTTCNELSVPEVVPKFASESTTLHTSTKVDSVNSDSDSYIISQDTKLGHLHKDVDVELWPSDVKIDIPIVDAVGSATTGASDHQDNTHSDYESTLSDIF